LDFNGQKATNSNEISEMFNLFFTSIKSDSEIDHQESEKFCDEFFYELLLNATIKMNTF